MHKQQRGYQSASNTVILTVSIILVCLIVFAVHWPALSAGALLFDDDQYLTNNQLVQNPSLASAEHFFAEILKPSTVVGYYQPLTMISLMLDYAAGGRENNLLPFHRTSLILHILNTILVILLLYLLFDQPLIAASLGLLFGVHPLTVEPLCWVSDRKTLLSTFFALGSLVLYVNYTRKNKRVFCLGSLLTYALALMSKPTAVMLPIVMLLMDYWPLNRLKPLLRQAAGLIFEKLPFFVLGGISAAVTYISQMRTVGPAPPAEYTPARILFIFCHNITFYLYKIIWPVNLAPHYPFPKPMILSNPTILAGLVGTCLIIALLLISLRWTKAAIIGSLISLTAIFPTMGLIGFTNVIAADKFLYLPSVGLLLILAAFLKWLFKTAHSAISCSAAAIIILTLVAAESFATRSYLAYWCDTLTLSERMLSVSPDAAPVHNVLGAALQAKGRLNEAIAHFQQALRINPNDAKASYNLGYALLEQQKFADADKYFRYALRLNPNYAEAHNNLGSALISQGRLDEAIDHFRQASQLKPGNPDILYNFGLALYSQGKFDDAIRCFRQAIQIKPDAEIYYSLSLALYSQGKIGDAVAASQKAFELANAAKNANLINLISRQLELYRQKQR
jgi:Flp pilus assembly protein TadD